MVNRDTERSNTQKSLLRAAEEEFMEYGYDAAKTVRIATAAGVTHAMLHYYFGTKQRLFNKVFEDKMQLLAQSLSLPLTNGDSPIQEKIVLLVEAHFDFIAANPKLPRFIINELVSNPERMAWFKETVRKIAKPLLAQMQNEADLAAERREICKTDVFDLIVDIVSLNVFPFLAMPVICAIKEGIADDTESFIRSRRRESAEIILQRLKP